MKNKAEAGSPSWSARIGDAIIVPPAPGKPDAADARASRPISPRVLGDGLRLLDIALILGLGLGIYLAYVHPNEPDTLGRYLVALLAGCLLASILFNDLGVYGGDVVVARTLRARRMALTWAATFAVLLAVAFALKISDLFSRVWVLGWFGGGGVALVLTRLAIRRWINRQARRGRFANRTAIVGTGEQARRLRAHLDAHDPVRTKVFGLFEPGAGATPGTESAAGANVLGDLTALVRMIRADQVDQVYVALPWNDPDAVRAVVRRLAETPVAIRLAPDLAGFDHGAKGFTSVAGLPVISLFERPISDWSYYAKAVEDRVLALLALAVMGVPMLLIAALIKLESPGPVLFRQRRDGFNNTMIQVIKFRTMHHHLRDPDGARLTTPSDARVTRVGRILRRASLDELPQIFNVLKGDMSLVGPRPHAMSAKAGGTPYGAAVEHYAARHRVKPGITGWAQVNGWRGETDTREKLQKRVECDLYYIDNWSLWLDLRIIVRTLAVPFKRDNAY